MVLSRSDLVSWANESGKTVDACKEVKALLDAGTAEQDLPDAALARLLKYWLTLAKQEGLEAKNITKGVEPPSQVDSDGKKAQTPQQKGDKKDDKTKQLPSTGKKPATAAPAKGPAPAKQDQNRPDSGQDGKKRSKLRDRTGKEKMVASIGDEPLDGPDMYYYLKDLDSPGLITNLIDECGLPLSAIFRVEDVNGGHSKKFKDQDTKNTQWEQLKTIAQNAPDASQWRDLAWINVSAADYQGSKEIFELLAKKIYGVLSKKKLYRDFYSKDSPLVIPNVQNPKPNMRYYDYLSSVVNLSSVDLQMGLLLEHIDKQGVDDEDPGQTQSLEEAGNVQMIFNKALEKLAFSDLSTDASKALKLPSLIKKTEIVSYHDVSVQEKTQLGYLETIGINTLDLLTEPQKHNRLWKQVLQTLEQSSRQTIEADAMRIKTEFHTTSIVKMEQTHLFFTLLQMQFEKMFDENAGPQSNFAFDAYCWQEAIPARSLFQAIVKRKQLKPVVKTQFSKQDGMLLMTLSSPGPLGCLSYSETSVRKVRTKVGFSLFEEMYEDIVESKQNERDPCYAVGDKIIEIHEKKRYMYPGDNFMIQIVESQNQQAKTSRTHLHWNDNTISMGYPQKTPYMTLNLQETVVFSISKQDPSISTKDGDWFAFQAKNRILYRNYHSNPKEVHETQRLFMPSGCVLKTLSDDSLELLHPDGSIELKNSQGWVKINKDGDRHPDSAGQPVKVAKGRNITSKTNLIIRSDFVQVKSMPDGSMETVHQDGTKITKYSNKIIIATSRVVVTYTNTEIVIETKAAKILRQKTKTGMQTVIQRPDLEVTVKDSGPAEVKFNTSVYKNAPLGLQLDWKLGSFTLVDFLSYVFTLDQDAVDNVIPPDEKSEEPLVFGPPVVERRVIKNPAPRLIGNTPALFCILPENAGGYELLQEEQIAQYYYRHSEPTRQDHVLVGNAQSLSLSSITKPQDATFAYRHLERFEPLDAAIRRQLGLEFALFQLKLKERSVTMTAAELGETQETPKLNQRFVFGANKDETQLVILLNHLIEERQNDPKTPNDNIRMRIDVPMDQMTPQTRSKIVNVIKQLLKSNKPQNKYFETPEGQEFLRSVKQTFTPPKPEEWPQVEPPSVEEVEWMIVGGTGR
ncbi:hypothetical protein EDD86DRAFT_95447 [Gorgonomyces haynaldii]|nr:hypothetical protein EDD86DRAFT_95447 [Gorgonomyces haynaldii]